MMSAERLVGFLHIGVKLEHLQDGHLLDKVVSIRCHSEVPRKGELTARFIVTFECVI